MIHPLVKIITVDKFYTSEQATSICDSVYHLQFTETEFGEEIKDFNLIQPDFSDSISQILNTQLEVDESRSGFFRIPRVFIHFEGFDSTNEWVFAVALQESIFNVYEHDSGTENALQGYKYNYHNLFEWNHKINYTLDPGQAILFRPWLFHSFDTGLIQTFRLREKE